MKQRFLPFFLNFMLFLIYLLPAFPIEEARIPGAPAAPPQSYQMVDINVEAHGQPPIRTARIDEYERRVSDQLSRGYVRLIPSAVCGVGSLIALTYYCIEYYAGDINIPALIATYTLAFAGVGASCCAHCINLSDE